MPSDLARPHIGGINHVGISVTNLERSIGFYCDALGAVLVRGPYSGERGFSGRMAILVVGSHVLDIFEHSTNGRERFEPAHTGLDHIGLTADSRSELHAWASWLDGCNVARSPIREVENNLGEMFDFIDPDGIQLEFLFIDASRLPAQSPEGVFQS